MVARGSGHHRPGCSGRRCAPTRWRSIGVTMVGTGWDDAVLVGDGLPKLGTNPGLVVSRQWRWICREGSLQQTQDQ